MEPTQNSYPVFVANQVLTSRHLNEIFNYLDEQGRLTRANLIGIGIVCGLEISLAVADGKTTIYLSGGCGVTSQGYLIVVPEEGMTLVSYKADYLIPDELDYPEFRNHDTGVQYPLWELFPAGEPATVALGSDSNTGFLDDKAVLLFLELKKTSLRNCSPKNCDDKGSEVTATLKPLLIKIEDLEKIIKAANSLDSGLTSSDLEGALLQKLKLPDISLPRFNVVNTSPATSNDIFAAFLNLFNASKLARSTAEALSAAYQAFKPLLQESYGSDPFGEFKKTFSFLDQSPTATDQVIFLQYYYDFFDDLLRAYDEFRWKGVELLCACSPSAALFPRHLMLGLLYPEKAAYPGNYRQNYLTSPAIGACSERSKEVLQLFRRLVEMIRCFTHAPGLLPQLFSRSFIALNVDPQIRVTPTVFGDKPLSGKAIPYYYQHNGTPPLYKLWNNEKTRRNRANQNLSYRCSDFRPVVPDFVSNPLRYDLEPHNFLRIEGHLGKNCQRVLKTLLSLKTQYRLPVEIIALRTGAYDDTQSVDVSKESVRFQDLEALYDTLREEVLATLTEGVRCLYDFPLVAENIDLPGGKPQHLLLKTHAPSYLVQENSVGAWYEKYWTLFESRPYINVNQNAFNAAALERVCRLLLHGTANLPETNYVHVVSIYFYTKLSETLPESLDALAYADFENKYQDLLSLMRYLCSAMVNTLSTEYKLFSSQGSVTGHFNDVLFSSKLDSIKSLYDEYVRRIRDLKKKQFLGNFLQNHPGIQHKAGVPIGGTFILVYHQDPAPLLSVNTAAGTTLSFVSENIANTVSLSNLTNALSVANTRTLTDAIGRISTDQLLSSNPDINLVLDSLSSQIESLKIGKIPVRGKDAATRIIANAVNELEEGAVIADFYLPYLISSDVEAVQFVLPKTQPTTNSGIVVNENEYEWIDSVKHLNYLCLRDYRPQKTPKAPAAHEQERSRLKDNYIVRIYHYEIQGQSLLPGNSPVDIVIPLQGDAGLTQYKLSAVARKLNEQFPLGLVFDTVAGTNKLVIRFIEGQKFRIELGGIQGNQIRYAYDNDMVYRRQHNSWEAMEPKSGKGLPSRMSADSYSAQEYQSLHQNFEPVTLTPVTAPTPKEAIVWEQVTLNRAKKYPAAAQLPIYESILSEIVDVIYKIDQNANVIVTGSWANGSWVSRNDAENIQSLEADITWPFFLELRKKVTGKTGYSAIDLLVESSQEITADMIKISTGYAIRIIRGKKDAQKGLVLKRRR
ncbi:MAG: hypothetical protein WCI81_05560 [Chlorobiaceae bacterium]